MYCFSQICRLCLNKTADFINVGTLDEDNLKIRDKLVFCVPEIVTDDYGTQLLENVCKNCEVLLQQMYEFKRMCISNANLLLKYIEQLSGGINAHADLFVAMDVNKTEVAENSMSISLNQWDLFETKYTCKCVKEYNSFTENTSHLCRNCEGELHGFQLSKVKIGVVESRYNSLKVDSDDGNSIVSNDIVTSNSKYEQGFNYNDFLLSKAHVNGVKRQIEDLSDESEQPDIQKLKIFKCPLCEKSYTRRYNLYNHYSKHEESKFYYCDKCSNKFITEDDYNNHELTHEKQGESETEITFEELNAGLNQSTSSTDSLTCSTCDKVFEHKSVLAIHLLTHVGNQEFKCECGAEFFRKENLQAHKKIHKLNRKYQCDQCEKSYNYSSNLRRHKFRHGGKYLCSICSEQFEKKDNLVDHIFEKHTKPTKYSCEHCEEVFQHSDHLKAHVMLVHSNPVFDCKDCDKSFNSEFGLKGHSKIHKKKRKTANFCEICQRSYSIKTSMRKHMLTHSKGKILTCRACKKKFTNMFLLREHVREHAVKEGFKCELCDKAYLAKSNLVRHMTEVHAE